MSACNVARNTDAEIRELLDHQLTTVIDQIVGVVQDEVAAGTAHPISDDIPALVRTLTATTGFMLSGDTTYLGPVVMCAAASGCSRRCGSTRCGAAGPSGDRKPYEAGTPHD